MEIPKQYNPASIEDKWYSTWMEKGLFRSVPDARESFTVVIPPPNVTGVLHMGHMLNNTIQDVLVRRARLQGKNACWVPGTDHASIATEAKVVNKLKEQGIEKNSLTREKFLEHAWEWTEKHGGIILEQLKKLGASCDWERTKFTMDDDMNRAVTNVFIDLYKKGLVYRGVRMVNWDPKAQTALSDEEVIYKETPSRLFHVRYQIKDSDQTITIATTRPETILGDTAICVHPEDERYTNLIGKMVLVPLINREIPIIADEYVDREFGTGALKVTPAHDINDYNLGIKYNLPVVDVIASDGTMSQAAQLYIGRDRFDVRKQIVKDIDTAGQLDKIEDIKNNVGYSERTDAVIEPRLSMQWFVKMEVLAKPALDAVNDGKVKLHPAKFINTYKYWMENVKDWCISRQLWWGQRIPAWYDNTGDVVVAANLEGAMAEFAAKGKNVTAAEIRQDEDVVDTWFSSWLWPITVFDADAVIKNPADFNADLKYYYPTKDLVTAPEILFFWVARMIMAGMEYCGDIPFSNVYLTGIVRDKQGRKMSKSLGNSPDPIELIEKFGADGVRLGMLLTSPAGNDLPFDESMCEQGRNFSNKIWNAFRLVKGWTVEAKEPTQASREATAWFGSHLAATIAEVDDLFSKYRISEALMTLYKLTWDDFCAWYLEAVKPGFEQSIDRETYLATIAYFEDILRLLHPFIPFITEEIWQYIGEREENNLLIVNHMPVTVAVDAKCNAEFDLIRELIASVRAFRNDKGLSPKEALRLSCKSRSASNPLPFEAVLFKLANLEAVDYVSEKPEGTLAILVRTEEIFLPVGEIADPEAEREKLQKELSYTEGFLSSVEKKLSNERFVSNAKPEVVAMEQKKMQDAIQRIQVLKEQLEALV